MKYGDNKILHQNMITLLHHLLSNCDNKSQRYNDMCFGVFSALSMWFEMNGQTHSEVQEIMDNAMGEMLDTLKDANAMGNPINARVI